MKTVIKSNYDTANPIVVSCGTRENAESIASDFSCSVTQYSSGVATLIPVMPTSEFIVRKLTEHGYTASINSVGRWL